MFFPLQGEFSIVVPKRVQARRFTAPSVLCFLHASRCHRIKNAPVEIRFVSGACLSCRWEICERTVDISSVSQLISEKSFRDRLTWLFDDRKAKVLNLGTARAPELAVTFKWYRTRRHYVVQRLGAMSEARTGSVYIRPYKRQRWISVSQN